jgi:hypothetical protein
MPSRVDANGTPRATSRLVASSPGCAPLKKAYQSARKLKPKSWSQVEDLFLRGMEGFDRNVATGVASMGDLQNGKGDFFNDLLALILEHCAGVHLYSRGSVPGLIFPKHNLDVAYPNSGPVKFVLEAKAVGTPKHPGSPRAKELGRSGSADLDKRIKEIGFKTIDLKAEYSRIRAEKGESSEVISGDLTRWLQSVKPVSFVFIAARVISDKDRERVFRMAHVASQVSNAVGVYCFRPQSDKQPSRYRAEKVPSEIEMSRVLHRACSELSALKRLHG